MTVDVEAITSAMEQAQVAAMQARIAENMLRIFQEQQAEAERVARAEREGWQSDPNEPDVEIRVRRGEVARQTEIEARFRLHTGEPEQCFRSVVTDHELLVAADAAQLLNEHIRMTVDRLCAERRQAEYERQRAERQRLASNAWVAYGNNYFNNIQVTSTAAITPYDWRVYTAASATTIINNDPYQAYTGTGTWQMQPAKPLTPEQIAAQKAAQEKWLADEKQRKAELAAAEEIAERLLLDVIGRHRFRIWKSKGVVHVSSRKYKNLRYEIKAGEKIKLLQREGLTWRRRRDSLCVHPRETHPKGDEVAALYALACFDEDEMWKTANRHGASLESMPEAA